MALQKTYAKVPPLRTEAESGADKPVLDPHGNEYARTPASRDVNHYDGRSGFVFAEDEEAAKADEPSDKKGDSKKKDDGGNA